MYQFTIRNSIVPGLNNVPSLKNNREHNAVKLSKPTYSKDEVQKLINVSRGNRPNLDARNFVKAVRNRYSTIMQSNGWEIIRKPIEVAVFYDLGVYFTSDLPKSDMDNALTTLQEALFTPDGVGPVIEDDNQIGFDLRRRTKTVNKDLTYSKIFVMIRWSNEHKQFLKEWENL